MAENQQAENDGFVIERGIPLPEKVGKVHYRWADMEPGDSVLFKNNTAAARSSLARFVNSVVGKHMTFETRSLKEGLRVWRIS